MRFLGIFSASLMLLTARVSAQDGDIQVWVRRHGGLELLYVKDHVCEQVDLTGVTWFQTPGYCIFYERVHDCNSYESFEGGYGAKDVNPPKDVGSIICGR